MKTIIGCCVAAAGLWIPVALAQPTVLRVSPETFNSVADEPVEKVAQGGVFRVFIQDLGLTASETTRGFPLTANLAGVSLRVTAGTAAIQALLLSVEVQADGPFRFYLARAVLPSSTPVGAASIAVDYKGQTSTPHNFQVVSRYFGWYDLVQNVERDGAAVENDFDRPARPGQIVVAWGVGLGAAKGDEAAGPVPSPLDIPGFELLVGGKSARILYAGRSGCCAGIDQIAFEVPAGVEGCNVAVKAVYPESGDAAAPKTSSLHESIAISPSGEACSDRFGIPRQFMGRRTAPRLLRYGWIEYSTLGWEFIGGFGSGRPEYLPPLGTCGGAPGWIGVPWLNAGSALHLRSPQVDIEAPISPLGAYYFYSRGDPPDPLPELAPDDYTLDNGGGGPGTGPFHTAFALPRIGFAWTNRDSVQVLTDQSLRIEWSGGDPDAGYVIVSGVFLVVSVWATIQGTFTCVERADKGRFTVPASELWTSDTRLATHLEFNVRYVFSHRFEAPGLDLAEFIYAEGSRTAVKIQ